MPNSLTVKSFIFNRIEIITVKSAFQKVHDVERTESRIYSEKSGIAILCPSAKTTTMSGQFRFK